MMIPQSIAQNFRAGVAALARLLLSVLPQASLQSWMERRVVAAQDRL